MKKETIKFCDYIESIKEDFEKGDAYLFVRLDTKDLNLVKSIRGRKVFTFEISQNRWEEVEWNIDDKDKIYPISVYEIIKGLKLIK